MLGRVKVQREYGFGNVGKAKNDGYSKQPDQNPYCGGLQRRNMDLFDSLKKNRKNRYDNGNDSDADLGYLKGA
jgi:hypothetical protein